VGQEAERARPAGPVCKLPLMLIYFSFTGSAACHWHPQASRRCHQLPVRVNTVMHRHALSGLTASGHPVAHSKGAANEDVRLMLAQALFAAVVALRISSCVAGASGRCSTSETRLCTSSRRSSAATTTSKASTVPRRRSVADAYCTWRYVVLHSSAQAAHVPAARLMKACPAAGDPALRSAAGTRRHRMGNTSLTR